jgi:hypothetical protein
VNQAVKSGAMSLNLAAQVTELPKEAQQEVAEAPPEQIKEVAREVVKRAHIPAHRPSN